ncbi:MAG: hypothetical protein DMG41_08550 [Acidobacteria bacterium]|nr:MAG: hypothetical protein AUH13_21835 [Acidobacteria bacterium 13_2_20CM_58_27]PYT77579.1 MAG: hypothetical protein DMG42_02320 [Acidobacteriota bacterium]PYT89314.1 MAG: hypothetical protein DMG41_08550 [Acidobacteriota bacterium]
MEKSYAGSPTLCKRNFPTSKLTTKYPSEEKSWKGPVNVGVLFLEQGQRKILIGMRRGHAQQRRTSRLPAPHG